MATVSGGKPSERFGFIQRYRHLGVTFLCNWLGVTRSGFYAWLKRKTSARLEDDRRLLKRITQIFWQSGGRYGSPRVFKTLIKEGLKVGRKRVERLMRESNLKARATRVTRRQPGYKRFIARGSNLLKDMSHPTSINQVWVADVTFIKVGKQWQYLATVMDLYSRQIIGWSFSTQRTTALTRESMKHALKKRGYPKGLLLHTDRGVEYTGGEFQKLLKEYDFQHSVNRPGVCTDNAFMESFFHSLKTELIRGNVYKKSKELRHSLATYINHFYNSTRLHSGLDYMSPIEYEQRIA